MKLGQESMPRVGPSGRNLEHYLKTHVYIYMYTVHVQVYLIITPLIITRISI